MSMIGLSLEQQLLCLGFLGSLREASSSFGATELFDEADDLCSCEILPVGPECSLLGPATGDHCERNCWYLTRLFNFRWRSANVTPSLLSACQEE